jgi:hypothetical protein
MAFLLGYRPTAGHERREKTLDEAYADSSFLPSAIQRLT